MNDADDATYTETEIMALENEHFGFSGPLEDDSEPEEPAPAAHPARCGCVYCDPDAHREMAVELAAGSRRSWRAS